MIDFNIVFCTLALRLQNKRLHDIVMMISLVRMLMGVMLMIGKVLTN